MRTCTWSAVSRSATEPADSPGTAVAAAVSSVTSLRRYSHVADGRPQRPTTGAGHLNETYRPLLIAHATAPRLRATRVIKSHGRRLGTDTEAAWGRTGRRGGAARRHPRENGRKA